MDTAPSRLWTHDSDLDAARTSAIAGNVVATVRYAREQRTDRGPARLPSQTLNGGYGTALQANILLAGLIDAG